MATSAEHLQEQYRVGARFKSQASANCDEPIFFHYTGSAGALGIIQTGEMWCTQVHHMNDSAELKYSFEQAQIISWRLSSKKFESDKHQRFVAEFTQQLERVERAHIFAASFSEAEDLLSQWRGYAANGGYSIGFSATSIAAAAEGQGFLIGEVVYRDEDQRKILEPIIEKLVNECESVDLIKEKPGDLDPIFWKYTRDILKVSPLIKHPAFAEEREWRLYSNPDINHSDRYDFIVRRDEIVPIIKFNLDVGRVSSRGGDHRDICFRTYAVGPGAHQSERSDAYGAAVQRYNVHWKMSHHSKAPLR